MDKYHKQSERAQTRRAVDGFLNAPAGRGRTIQSAPQDFTYRQKRPVFHERLKSAPSRQRLIGDFSLADGYHSSDRSRAGRVHDSQQTHRSTKPAASHSAEAGQDNYIRHQFEEPVPSHKQKSDTARPRKRLSGRRGHKQRSGWKKFALRGSLALVAMVVVMGGYLLTTGYLNLNKIFQGGGAAAALDAEVDPTKLRGEGDGRVNVLLLGRGGEGHDGADLTDTIIVASIDPVNKKAALVSIPRDLWVDGAKGESKVNAVFALAKNAATSKGATTAEAEKKGIAAIENEAEEITGLTIHYYAMIDFQGFAKAVDTIGGVNINVPEELRDSTMAWQNNWNPVLAKAGMQKMNGKQALMYVRSRHGSARGDFDRAERQRIFLSALKDQIMSAGTYSNPVKVSRLMNDFGNHAKTDFSLDDLMRLYNLTKGVSSFESISFVDAPHDFLTTGTYSGQSIVKPKAGVYDYSEVKDYLRSALPDGYIVKENAPVTVLNGTTKVGVAAAKAEELKSYGYNVVATENAPTQNYASTVIINVGGDNKYTQNYLEKRFDTKATKTIPEGIQLADDKRKGFIIIIGQDEAISQ